MRDLYLTMSSKELKERLATYTGALATGTLKGQTYESIHDYMNEIIDILKERNEL
jgi:hypothetical protein